jgi:uncharacterized DUF497 family protein
MRFEWDAAKARKDLRKHGVSFDEASSVFYDRLAVTGADPDHSEGEVRLVSFGRSAQARLLVVAHTERNEVVRIISSRTATAYEREIYEEG